MTPAVRPALLWLARLLAVVAAGVLVLGTVVTGTGPHSGDADDPARFGFDLVNVSQLHADGAMLLVGLVVAAAFAVRVADAPAEARRISLGLVAAVVAQAVIGFVQYFTGVPALLVALHMTGATVLWIFAIRLWLAMSARPAVPSGADGPDRPDRAGVPGPTAESTEPDPATVAEPSPATAAERPATAAERPGAAVPTSVGPAQRG